MAGTESGATPRWMKVATGIVVPVLVAILVAALTPLGDSLREILFPTASTVRGSAMMSGAPLSRALVTLDGKTTTTTRLDGSFEFSRVSAREHTLGIVAAGANDFHTSFDVKRGSEETPLPPVDLTPAVKLAARVSIAVQPPNPFTLTFRLSYDIAA